MPVGKQEETLRNSVKDEYTYFDIKSAALLGCAQWAAELLAGHRRQNEGTTESNNFQGRRISVLLLFS